MHDLSGGGVERMRLALIAELGARGCEVMLVVSARAGALAASLPADLSVVELGARHTLGSIVPLARFLRSTRPDVLVSSLDHNNVTAILARLLARTSTRVVICQHNALSAEQAMGWRYRLVPWLYWFLRRGAHGFVAVSKGVADDLAITAGIPRRLIDVIYNPVIGRDFSDRLHQPPPHDWLHDRKCPVFVFAGRLTEQKDPATLLSAMAKLMPHRAARLIVLGEGTLLSALEAMAVDLGIASQVAFVGFQRDPLPWIRHADALVSTSRYEGLGNVIIEALACGTPVIATDCPHGPSEILLAGQFGRLVPVGSADDLALAMQAEIDTPMDEKALVRRAAVFTAAACADAHQLLFKRVLERPVAALGMRLSPLRAEQVLDRIMAEPPTVGVRLIVTPNLDHVRLLRRADFAAAYRSAELVCPDGFPVLLYARLRGLILSSRVTGCDLFRLLARHPRLASQRPFLVVESERTAEAVSMWSARQGLSRLKVAVAPRFLAADPAAQASLAAAINLARPTILVMTLGAPISEVFVHTYRDHLPPCWVLCVGQAVRVELGLAERAPDGWRRMGLEWLWRVRQEPRRLLARYVRALAWFPVAVLRDICARAEVRS
jgi:exopolysaccharide biosynthesis WecB/TagA/CpsF family protein